MRAFAPQQLQALVFDTHESDHGADGAIEAMAPCRNGTPRSVR